MPAPGGLVGYPRAYSNQFREFNSHRVHLLVGTFSCVQKKQDSRKARQRELATFDENRRAVGICLLYTSPSPRDGLLSRMPSSA